MSRRIRPTTGATLIAALGVAFTGAAQTSGAGWLIVLVAVCAALLAVGAIGPLVAMWGLDVSLRLPSDAVAGAPLMGTLEVRRPRSPSLLEVVGFGPPLATLGRGNYEVRLVAPSRGVVTNVSVEVRCATPFGLVWVQRTMVFPTEVFVAPAPVYGQPPNLFGAAHADDGTADAGADGEVVGGVREYRRGDPLKRIHWVSTARFGRLHVREFHHLEHPGVDIVVELTGTPEQQEARAGEVAGQAFSVLAIGVPLRLHTLEADGPVSGAVATRRDVNRRLARAVAGSLPASIAAVSV